MAKVLITGGMSASVVVTVAAHVIENANTSLVNEIKTKRYHQKEQYVRNQTQGEESLKQLFIELSARKCELKEKEETIQSERSKIEKYQHLRNDENTKFMVVLGHTGDGKSTVLNRLYGDDSEYGDQGVFRTSDDVDSETTNVSHLRHQIRNVDSVLVDSPGYKDSNGDQRDDEHFNNLGEYLYGCGGVDVFVLVMNGTNVRFDGNIQSMLRYYVKYFGANIWHHLIIVMTRIEGYEEKKFHDKNRAQIYQQKLHDTFDSMDKECVVPIIPIGYGYNYDTFRENVMNAVETISNLYGKLECKYIESPIRQLEKERDVLEAHVEGVKKDIENVEDDIEKVKKLLDEEQNKIDNPSTKDKYPIILNRKAEI